jgi:hypothetical protein
MEEVEQSISFYFGKMQNANWILGESANGKLESANANLDFTLVTHQRSSTLVR